MSKEHPPHAPALLKLLAHDIRWQLLVHLRYSDATVAELVHLVGSPQNLISYHLRRLREYGVIGERRSDVHGRSIYYHLNLAVLQSSSATLLTQLHPFLISHPSSSANFDWSFPYPAPRLLFLCTGNSARSQVAEALLRALSRGQVQVYSAGSHPTSIHPLAIRAAESVGVDIHHHISKHVDVFRGQSFDYVITLCDHIREICPSFVDHPKHYHWSIPNPAQVKGSEPERVLAFEQMARDLKMRIQWFLPHLALPMDERRCV